MERPSSQNVFSLGAPLSRIVILGGRSLSETVARFARDAGIDLHIFSAPRQQALTASDGILLSDRLAALGCSVRFITDLGEDDEPVALAGPGTLVLSFGCPFGLDSAFFDAHENRCVNMHNTALPRYRGGGGYSWQIMAGDREGAVTFHVMTSTWEDNGPIIHQRKFRYPETARFPRDYEAIADQEAATDLLDFLKKLHRGKTFNAHDQDGADAVVLPRLSTDNQAFIDWSWSGDLIERFVLAFSHPYPGAMTFCDGEKVRILNCRFKDSNTLAHPFINGIVFRRNDGSLRISCYGGELIFDESDIKAETLPEAGQRFHTPVELLDATKTFGAGYDAAGLVKMGDSG